MSDAFPASTSSKRPPTRSNQAQFLPDDGHISIIVKHTGSILRPLVADLIVASAS
jgi:hypothetical protein